MSRNRNRGLLANLKVGDVLISHASAALEQDVRIVPDAPLTSSPTHDAVLHDTRLEVGGPAVDAWLTDEQTHVFKTVSHPTDD